MASLKGNIILNGINTITGILFPVITFPYAARVLLPDGIGTINFLNSIINYIVLLTSLGIPMYAVKEIARQRDDIQRRSQAAIEIITLSFILCLLGYLIVWVLAKYIPQINKDSTLFFILSLAIFFNSIGVNWFYQGIEDFKFITIRGIIIRIISTVMLFIFVKDSFDLLNYGIILVGATVGNNFINFIHLRKYISLKNINIHSINIGRHITPTLQVFVFNIIVSLYIQLNSVMLGFITGDDSVGFYTAGTKITHIAVIFITSIGTVLLPRCSHLISIGDYSTFHTVVKKTVKLTLFLAFPIAVGLTILSGPVTMIFCGKEYLNSIPVLLWNAPLVLFISLTSIMAFQILYPLDKIKTVIFCVTGGAIINIISNILLIPHMAATGAAISTFFAEITVFILLLILGKQYLKFNWMIFIDWNLIEATLLMALTMLLIYPIFTNDLIKLFSVPTIGTLIYVSFLLYRKDKTTLEIKLSIQNIFRRVSTNN